MKITDKIYIDLDEEPTSVEILSKLTYPNPEYYAKMNMGISVYKVPQEIKTYEIKGRELQIFRGEALRIKEYIGGHKYGFDHPDHPISLQYVNEDFDLDEYQERAIEAIKGTRQGVVHAVTSAGKSLIILKAICELGQRALIIVHRKVLMQQLLEDIEKYVRTEDGEKIVVGIIGGGKRSIGDITIGIDKSIASRISFYEAEFGAVVLDECHIAPTNTISQIINSINAKYRFGFSGTLRRKDQKEFLIFATFGQVIATIEKEELLEKGRVVPVRCECIDSETRFDWDGACEELGPTKARHLQEKTIALDPTRNKMILDKVSKLEGKTIVLSRYVDPCYRLQEALREDYGMESGVITGKNAKEAIASYNAMKHSDLKVIFATVGCVSTGVSISDLDNIVLISPIFTNELLIKQITGRLFRTFPGKTHGTLYYIYDQYIFPYWKLKKFLSIVNS